MQIQNQGHALIKSMGSILEILLSKIVGEGGYISDFTFHMLMGDPLEQLMLKIGFRCTSRILLVSYIQL